MIMISYWTCCHKWCHRRVVDTLIHYNCNNNSPLCYSKDDHIHLFLHGTHWCLEEVHQTEYSFLYNNYCYPWWANAAYQCKWDHLVWDDILCNSYMRTNQLHCGIFGCTCHSPHCIHQCLELWSAYRVMKWLANMSAHQCRWFHLKSICSQFYKNSSKMHWCSHTLDGICQCLHGIH